MSIKLDTQAKAIMDVAERAYTYEVDSTKTEGSLSNDLLKAAKGCKDKDDFLKHCDMVELQFKAKHNTKKMPRAYIKPKSTIKLAWEHGLDPHKYTSESSLRKKLESVRGAQKKAKPGPQGETTEKGEGGASAGGGVSSHDVLNKALQGIIHQLHKLEKVPPEHQAEAVTRAEELLANCNAELVDVVDKFVEMVGGTVEKVDDTEDTKAA